MADTPFVHLHCHTDYSLLDGACEISQLMDTVAAQKMPAVAMTDHGNLFGAVSFYNTARAKGIHPVIGCEVYVSQQGRLTRSDSDRYNHLVLLCENQEGYRNLIDLVSTAYLEGFYYKPRIDKDLLAHHSKGLIAMSACLRGDINETILADRYDEARRLAYTYQDIFGRGNFFLEIQDHGLEQDKRVTPQVNRLSAETGIPLVATNDAHYLQREDARAHEILMCIQTGKTMSDPARMHWDHPDFYLKSRAEMMQLFGELEDSLDRTWEIAQRCQVKLEKIKEPFPRFDVPTEHTTDTYFEFVARQGFEKRRPRLEALRAQGRLKHDPAEYAERLDREIKMIQQMKFSGYFLIVWDFIRFAKSKSIPVGPGRGSAAGSLVSYAMEITDIDPLEYGLLFERFLNPERISMPDIDIDFCMNRRGEVIQYVTEKYGRDQVAQIITFNTLATRAAIKDVGRVLDMSFADVDRITKLVPNVLNISLDDAIKAEPGFDELAKKDPRVAEILQVARRLEGLARNCSVHAAGVVISPEPLKNLVPLYKTNKDEIVTQYDMNGLEKLSLLKMDFLGLTTLTLIDDALKLIEKRHGVKLVLEDLPLEDPKAYEIFSQGIHQRRVPVRIAGHARRADALQADAHRGSHGAERALSSGTHEGRDARRFHRAQARPQSRGLRSAGAAADSRRNLRRDSVSGAGDADLEPPGGLLAGRSRHSAPRHGQEEGRGDGGAARALHQGRAGAQLPATQDREDFRSDGAIRGIRLQQIALGRVCVPGLRDGVSQSALSGGFHGGAADFGNRQPGEDREVHQ